MAYKVLKKFRDKTDNEKLYTTKDTYESNDSKRVAFLEKEGFIEAAAATADEPEKVPTEPKHVGGGTYELPNGDRVKGKEEALAALRELEARGE